MRKITVTEENFEEVLSKIQKICRKHKLLRFNRYYYYKNGEKYPDNAIITPVNTRYNEEKNRTEHVLTRCFFNPEKHHFRKAFEENPEGKGYDASSYREDELKPLIIVQYGPMCSWLLHSGDQIRFYPFGIFSTFSAEFYDHDKYEKNLFIPSFFKGKLRESDIINILIDWKEFERKSDEQYIKTEMDSLFDDFN